MNKNPYASVLIVGAGPTGLVLALWLTRLGIRVRIIDKSSASGETSRALAVQARTLEFYNQIGIAEHVIASGIKLESFSFRRDSQIIKTVSLHDIGLGISPYPFVLSFPQDDHEKILLEHLEENGIVVERKTELLSFTQNDTKVTAIIDCQGQQETAEFDYLCGCDGARSTVREQLNIKFPGGTYNQMFYVADVHTPEPITNGVQLGVSKTDFCVAFPVRSSKTVRLIGIVPAENANKDQIEFADVKDSIARNMPIPITDVNWFSTYHVHHRVVPKFQVGRVFLAGDSAHIHSPVGGQGMNTGIGDAVNLSWKLAAVLQGQCHEKILETYELERLPFAKKLVASTDRAFQIITSDSILGSTWRHVVFPHLFPLMFQHRFSSLFFFKFVSQIKIKYRHSPLSFRNSGKIQAGDRLPWVRYDTTDNFESLKSLAWQVHVYGQAKESLREVLKTPAIPVLEFEWNDEAKRQGIIHNAAYLIRPDGYISVIDVTEEAEHIKNMLNSIQQITILE